MPARLLPLVGLLITTTLAPAADRPNVVFIFSDDHAYQAISAYGDPRKLLDTPNLDRLAKEGMRFDRCLVPNSICGPSRATVLTGTYNHINGFYNNEGGIKFDGSQVTFPKLLKAAGYQTAVVGKWHLVTDPTGFDYWHILPGQGIYYNPPMIEMGKRVQARRLRHRHHHRPVARLARQAGQDQAVPAHVLSTRPRTANGRRPCVTSATTRTATTRSRTPSSTTTPAAARPRRIRT